MGHPGRERLRGFSEILGGEDEVHLFLHNVSGLLADGRRLGKRVSGVWEYADRALILAGPRDIVCLPSPPDEGYLEYLSRFEMGPLRERIVVANDSSVDPASTPLSALLLNDPQGLLRIVESGGKGTVLTLNPFVLTKSDVELAALLESRWAGRVRVLGGPLEVARPAGLKSVSRRMAEDLGIPVPPADVLQIDSETGAACGECGLEELLRERVAEFGALVLKGSEGASGSATWVVTPESPIEEVVRRVRSDRTNREYLLEPRLSWTVSPNLQFFLEAEGRGIHFLGATDQKVDSRLVHQGNLYPSRARSLRRMVDHGAALCGRLRRDGYVGFVGLDFIEVETEPTREPAPFFCEINPRVNAATYLLALRNRVNRLLAARGGPRVGAFGSLILETSIRGFDRLCELLSEDLYLPGAGEGAFPLAAGPLRQGKVLLGLLGSNPAQVGRLEERVRRRLGSAVLDE